LVFEKVGKLGETKGFVRNGDFVVENGVGAESWVEGIDGLKEAFASKALMVFLGKKPLAKIGSAGLVAKIKARKSFFENIGRGKGVNKGIAGVFVEGFEKRPGLRILFFFELGDIVGVKNGITTGSGDADLVGVKGILNNNYLGV
jgi:hypothetical protein